MLPSGLRQRRARTGKNCRFPAIHRASFACRKVDNRGHRRLYRPSWARRRLARWCVCEAPHCSHGDRASGHDLVAMFASPRRMCGLPRLRCLPESGTGRRSREVPGCLKSESEERETWTAESLRAAFANGEGLPFSRDDCGHGRDFGGRRFRSTLWTTCEAHASQETKVGPRQTL